MITIVIHLPQRGGISSLHNRTSSYLHNKIPQRRSYISIGDQRGLERLDVDPCEMQLGRKGNCGKIVYVGKIKGAVHFEFVKTLGWIKSGFV